VVRLRAHPLHGPCRIADHLGVGNAARGSHLGGDVVGVGVAAATLPLVEVRADREIAVVREPTRLVDIDVAPARQMVDEHDARKRARTGWLGDVGGDRRSFVACDGHVLAGHASVE